MNKKINAARDGSVLSTLRRTVICISLKQGLQTMVPWAPSFWGLALYILFGWNTCLPPIPTLPGLHVAVATAVCLRTSDRGCMAAKLQVFTMCLSADRALAFPVLHDASKQFKRSEFSWSSTAQAAPVPFRASLPSLALWVCVFLWNGWNKEIIYSRCLAFVTGSQHKSHLRAIILQSSESWQIAECGAQMSC